MRLSLHREQWELRRLVDFHAYGNWRFDEPGLTYTANPNSTIVDVTSQHWQVNWWRT